MALAGLHVVEEVKVVRVGDDRPGEVTPGEVLLGVGEDESTRTSGTGPSRSSISPAIQAR